MVNELLRRILFLPPQASTLAREIDYLHYFVILTTMFGAAAITVVGVIFLARYRQRGTDLRREDPTARPPVWAEAAVIGGLLSLFCLWWLIGFVQFVKMETPPENALAIYVTGKQWMWKFAYPDGGHTISTLYVPTGRPVKLLLASRDVIHSFYVPDFRIKQDAVPGRITTTWFEVSTPGVHTVFCAEYCGTSHSRMRAQVIALAPEDYARWLAGAHRPDAVAGAAGDDEIAGQPVMDLARVGRDTAAELGCLRCHTLDGSPFIGPTWAGLYRSTVPLRGGGRVLADEAYLTESMMDPAVKLHEGFPAVMPSYLGRLSPGQTATLVELIRSLRDVPPRPAAAVSVFEARGEQSGLPPPGAVAFPPPKLPIEVRGTGGSP